ncbi:MAG TPA: hypothetical protein VJA66_07905 [Thermoanaerobaculia bacterium]
MRHFIAVACTLALTNCGDSPTQPTQSTQPPAQEFVLVISGTLTPVSGLDSIQSVAILFDRVERGNKRCASILCHSLDVSTSVASNRGAHSIEIQLLGRLCDFMPCTGTSRIGFSGIVTVYKAGAVVQQLPLAQQTRDLSEGDKISYQVTVNP